jgi:ElaB/YqjD/DUF883 family membrane-anchored ribosome-binding protein
MKSQAKEALDEGKNRLNEKLKEFDLPEMEEMKELATELADQAAEAIKKYPLPSVIGALALGFVLGNLWGRKK